jgi:hypothetical protein
MHPASTTTHKFFEPATSSPDRQAVERTGPKAGSASLQKASFELRDHAKIGEIASVLRESARIAIMGREQKYADTF